MAALWLRSVSLMVLLVVLWPGSQAFPQPQHLCGSHLVDALILVCEDRGFQFTQEMETETRKKRNIVEQCCFQSCTLDVIQSFCK